jgi:radical SAM superfamily enzyme YgiQ (UPF0313 family)
MTPNTRTVESSILLLSCYESGHQPINLGWPLAFLAEAGLSAQTCDLSVEEFPTQSAAQANFVGISVPMHTALRLGVHAAERVRGINPAAHICFFGLYAWLNSEHLLDNYADSVIAGEFENPLVDLIQILDLGGNSNNIAGVSTSSFKSGPHIARLALPVPDRKLLPPLANYAHYTSKGVHTIAGYVEASRGCLHTCTHCPVVPIYNGRFFVVPLETVLADIRQQVAAGAGHITFGDPDFLNGPGHALKIIRSLHDEFPHLTFNITTKVEHIIKHRQLFPELAQLGCTFITSAFESTQDRILNRLQKGHSLADMHTALEILGDAGIAVQPTWMPFTPWTALEDYLHLLAWIRSNDLIPHVPAVQLSIRMLVPPNSALLDHPDVETWLGPLDATNFTYSWEHPDQCMDELQLNASALAELPSSNDPVDAFNAIESLANEYAGITVSNTPVSPIGIPVPPQLSEHWFC